MIVSHSSKFIFIKTRKTAGTSVEAALRKFLDPGDIMTPLGRADAAGEPQFDGPAATGYQYGPLRQRVHAILGKTGKRIFGYPHTRFYSHVPAYIVRRKLGKKIWDGYFKFSIVRNPYDMLVSLYMHERSGCRLPEGMGFGEFVRSKFVRPRNVDLVRIGNRNEMDAALRFESLYEDSEDLGQRLGFGSAVRDRLMDLQINNQHRTSPDVAAFYDKSLQQYVAWRFAFEFRLFGYDPDVLPKERD